MLALPHRAGVHQGPDPRALSQRDLSRRRLLRRRRGGAQLFRQVARRADASAEAAFLAGLPKAPNSYHPMRQPEARQGAARLGDRPHARGRLHHRGRGRAGEAEPLVMRAARRTEMVTADYFTEEVRRELVEQLRRGRASTRAACRSAPRLDRRRLQAIADEALRARADRLRPPARLARPVAQLDLRERPSWPSAAGRARPMPAASTSWQLAVVLAVDAEARRDRPRGRQPRRDLPLAELAWARRSRRRQPRPAPSRARPIRCSQPATWSGRAAPPADDGRTGARRRYALRQMPGGRGRGGGARPAHRPRAGDERRLQLRRASSTAPPRRCASRARRSSRSSIWPALENGFTPVQRSCSTRRS